MTYAIKQQGQGPINFRELFTHASIISYIHRRSLITINRYCVCDALLPPLLNDPLDNFVVEHGVE